MKALTSKLIIALLLAAALTGCASIGPQESAYQWMEHQSNTHNDE